MEEPRVIYQDNQVVVIDKPAGMVVNRAESVGGETVQDWMEQHFGWDRRSQKAPRKAAPRGELKETEGTEEFTKRSGVVHRLDKDTSGVMVVAKTVEMFMELQRQFRERETEKVYMALVHGKLEPKEGAMRLPLGRSRKDRKKFTVGLLGKVAETKWRVGDYLRRGDEVLTLVELFPRTGRTHQLRVHLKHLKHPVVGDGHYLGKKRAKEDAKWVGRQFLHAKKLCVWLGGEKRCFEAELPEDLGKVLEKLHRNPNAKIQMTNQAQNLNVKLFGL